MDTALELVAQPVAVVPAPATLFGTNEPKEMVQRAASVASALTDVIRAKHLYKTIRDKNYVFVQGWTLLGSMLGVFPVVVWTRPLDDGMGWEARVEARTLSGQVVGAAEAQCTRKEKMWGFEPTDRWGKKLEPRDDFALRSMAQTRARSKALQGPLDFVITLAGYEGTPAEEMGSEDLSERLEASIAAVRARKAAKTGRMQGDNVGVNFHFENNVSPPGSQPPEMSDPYKAPPLCPACKSPVGRFVSESQAHKGRAYWQCQRANDRVLELEERKDPPLTYAQIYADKGVRDHWRTWAEPWPRKEEPRDGQP